jgi:hypothetical protein
LNNKDYSERLSEGSLHNTFKGCTNIAVWAELHYEGRRSVIRTKRLSEEVLGKRVGLKAAASPMQRLLFLEKQTTVLN